MILEDIRNENYPNLKKWLRYQLFQRKDADKILKKSDVILKLEWYKEDVDINKRYLDCIFSMKTYLNMFLKLYNLQATNYAWLLIYFDDVLVMKTSINFVMKIMLKSKILMFYLMNLKNLRKIHIL